MGRFGCWLGPFWSCFFSIGAVLVGAVLVCVGRFRPSLGPFWRWAVLVGVVLVVHVCNCETVLTRLQETVATVIMKMSE